jgi:hypothetical protein
MADRLSFYLMRLIWIMDQITFSAETYFTDVGETSILPASLLYPMLFRYFIVLYGYDNYDTVGFEAEFR